jgi:predicted ATPase
MKVLTGKSTPEDEEWINNALNNLPERQKLRIRDLRRDVELFMQDVGVGLSQVIPVLVAAIYSKEGIFAIEEPETNIHPAFQVVLGDLFISQIQKKPNQMFLVETHSEHLMLRFLRRIRESADGDLPPGFPKFSPEDLSVLTVSLNKHKDAAVMKRIKVNEDGNFSENWPNGFFEEGFKERFS